MDVSVGLGGKLEESLLCLTYWQIPWVLGTCPGVSASPVFVVSPGPVNFVQPVKK